MFAHGPQISEFEVWFHSASDEAQREALAVLRRSVEELGVTVTYTHSIAFEDSLITEDALDLLTGRRPQFPLD